MSKIAVFLLLFLRKSFGLMCYTTDFNSYLSSNVTENPTHKLEDCNEYIKNIPKTDAPLDSVRHCYTVGTDYPDIVLKGCFPRNSCDDLKDSFKKIIETKKVPTDIMGNIQCNECEDDRCNLDSDLFFPTPTPTKAGRTVLECYYCAEPCDASRATKDTCELFEDGVCTVETSRENKSLAIRGCQKVPKGSKPVCLSDSLCSFCGHSLCNLSPGAGTGTTIPSLELLSISFGFSLRYLFKNK